MNACAEQAQLAE